MDDEFLMVLVKTGISNYNVVDGADFLIWQRDLARGTAMPQAMRTVRAL
jgi:hypothetical protein